MNATAMKLYEHVDQLEAVLDWIADNEDEIKAAGGELPPEVEQMLDQVEGDLKTKVERTALVIQNQLANAAAAKAEADRLSKIAGTYQRQADALKAYLKAQLDRAGIAKVETPLAKVWTQTNGRPSIRPATDEIPPAFQRVKIEFDGALAYETVKDAKLIPEPKDGRVQALGLIIERGTHLRIR
jgi:hypothetical protein